MSGDGMRKRKLEATEKVGSVRPSADDKGQRPVQFSPKNNDLQVQGDGDQDDEESVIERRRRRRQEILYKHAQASSASGTGSIASSESATPVIETGTADHVTEEVPASAYHERNQNDRAILLPTATEEEDMFAEDACMKPGEAIATAAIAKELDVKLLDNWDDVEGYYRIIPGEMLSGRYRIDVPLGKGVFSAVVRARDTQASSDVAIKIMRNNETLRRAGLKEIGVLEKLASSDLSDQFHVIRLLGHFEHKQHLCLVFENLDLNLREVLKKFGRRTGLNLKAVRAYTKQIFLALDLLRRCNILHADLKPDNILVNESRTLLKVCDLGSASDASENEITPYLASRFYRAPEIMLGHAYDFAIDVWSAGCTLFELFTGKILFPGLSNNDMLRRVFECRGKPGNKFIRRGKFWREHFDEMVIFQACERDRFTGRDTIRALPLLKPMEELKTRVLHACDASTDVTLCHSFIAFLEKCLQVDPARRISAAEALQHPFLQ